MPRLKLKIGLTGVVVFACIASVWAGKNYFNSPGTPRLNSSYAARAMGDPKARVWVVQYMEFGCLQCIQTANYLEEYVRQKPHALYWQVRFFPYKPVPNTTQDPELYALCAASQNKFWPFFRLLVAETGSWFKATDRRMIFNKLAERAGLNPAALGRSLKDPKIAKQIAGECRDAEALKVRFSSTTFVNGTMIVGFDALKKELQKHEGNRGGGAK